MFGQFSVKYQVEMDPDGEVQVVDCLVQPVQSHSIQVIDGYFVHFTEDATDLGPLSKYTVFVLDVSAQY